jgi:predicted Zn finger-like uncharacterized protein
MDVRCEKCLTVYEFDEAQVTPQGVTVKCTQCGNLFKVKKRETAEFPVFGAAQRSTAANGTDPGAARPARPSPASAQPAAPPVLVRLALTGEVYKAADVATVGEWARQRKVMRDDQLSRDGTQWRPLSSVPELAPIFVELEAAQEEVPLALSTTAPMSRNEGPSDMGFELGPTSMGGGDPAFASTQPTPRVTGPHMTIPPIVDELADLELPRPRRVWPAFAVLLLFAVAGAAGYVTMFRKDLVRQFTGASRAEKAYAAARAKLALDTDDGFRQAVALFNEAHGADENDPLPLAGLAEAESQWAWYLREDAHALDGAGPQVQPAAAALRKEAQGHLDDAKRAASDALALDPDSAVVNRAMADFLRVDGAPAAEVRRYLERAQEKAPGDADALFVGGALAVREGQLGVARPELEKALKQAQATSTPLYRGSYLLARVASTVGGKDEARTLLQGVLAGNPQHERAKTFLSQLDAAPVQPSAAAMPDAGTAAVAPKPLAAGPAPATPPATTPPAATPPAATPPAATPPTAAKPDAKARSGDYNKLVAQADKQSENGHAEKARKLYEDALAVNPQGVEAITGLGYCDLDKERYLNAIDRFREALALSPDYGDALMGIAEAYKVQGNRAQAIEHYRRYLRVLPHGPKATMAQKNLRDLEPREHGLEPATAKPEKVEKGDENETPLPRLPGPPPAGGEAPPPP